MSVHCGRRSINFYDRLPIPLLLFLFGSVSSSHLNWGVHHSMRYCLPPSDSGHTQLVLGRFTRVCTLVVALVTGRLGFHPMRQVGFDTTGRPILYVAFAQATNYWFKVVLHALCILSSIAR